MPDTRTLRPGYLVSLRTQIKGGVRYEVETLDPDHTEGDARVAEWKTRRTVEAPEEHAQAIKVRSKARSFITSVCTDSAFGYLCPLANRDALDTAIANARIAADSFNAGASIYRITVNVIKGEVASDDLEAIRAIRGEIADLLESMTRGIAALDPEEVRKAANKAREVAGMLTPEASGRVAEAIKEARAAAREMVKRAGEAGESAAGIVAEEAIRRIEEARLSFLDLEAPAEVPAEAPIAPALDLMPSESIPEAPPAVPALPALEM